MKSKKLEIVLGVWAIFSVAVVTILAANSSPVVTISVGFALLIVTTLGMAYMLLLTLRKIGRAGTRNAEQTRRQLGAVEKLQVALKSTVTSEGATLRGAVTNSEAARARAANKVNVQLNSIITTAAVTRGATGDSEAARVRAANGLNAKINTAIAAIRGLESQLEQIHVAAESARGNGRELLAGRENLVDGFTDQTIKLDLYIEEMREALKKVVPSYKQSILDGVLSDQP